MSDGTIGHGATIGYGAVLGAYTDIGEVVSIQKGAQVSEKTDFTHLTSTNRFKESKTGMIDPGEYQITVNTIYGATRTALKGYHQAGTTLYWRFRAYDTSVTPATLQETETFAGIVMNVDDGTIAASDPKRTVFTVMITGAITEV